MVSQSGNIFSLKDQGDFDKWGRVEAYTSGTYDFEAQEHRGIDCSANIKFESSLGIDAIDAKVVKAAKAAFLQVGAEAEAGLSLIASFPLDLFEEAGVVVCFQAQAKASGVVKAGLELDANTFYLLVRKELEDQANSQWLDLAEIFFDEVVYEAGLLAMASFTAGITAEAFMLGCLLPTSDDKEAGFTFSVQYSAGFKYGYGMRYLSNIGFKNPQQLLNRLSDKMVYIIEDALTQHIPSDDIEAQQAMAYFKLFLPLATRTAFTLGYDLVNSESDQKAAETSIVQSFVSEVQELLLSSLFDLAVHELSDILQDNVDELIKLDEKNLNSIYNALTKIRGFVHDLRMLKHATGKELYLFSWDENSGNDCSRLIKYIEQKYDIDCSDCSNTAKFEKIDDKTITISTEKFFLSLKFNGEKSKINLEIDDGRTDEFFVKVENGNINIEWFDTVLGLLDPLMDIITGTDLFNFKKKEKEKWEENVALLWSAAVLVYQVVDWVADDNKPKSNPFTKKPIENTDSDVANYVLNRVNPNGTELSLSHLVQFILMDEDETRKSRIEILSSTFKNMEPLLVWLQDVFTSSDLLETLLEEPAKVDEKKVIQILSTTMGDLIENKVIPILFNFDDEFEQKYPDLPNIVNQVVKPALISIPYIVLPGISKLGEDGMDKKLREQVLREQVSAVLLLFLSRLLLTSTNVLTKEALDQGSDAIRKSAEEVKRGEQNDILTKFKTLIALSTLGVSCLATPPAVSAHMKSIADVIDYWNCKKHGKCKRENLFNSMEKLIYLGVSTGDEGLESVWTTLENTDDPPLKGELKNLTENLMEDGWDLLLFVTEESFETLGEAFRECGDDFFDMIKEGWKLLKESAKKGIEWFKKESGELNALLGVVNGEIGKLTESMRVSVEKLAGILSRQRIIDDTIDHIRNEGWKYVNSNVPKKFKKYSEKYVKPIYCDFFNKNKYLLVYPLRSFIPNLAYCANLDVEEQLNLGRTLNKNILISNLKNDARKTSISDMKIPVKFKKKVFGQKIRINLGTFTLPGNLIIGYAIDYVFSRTDVNNAIGNIVNKGNEIGRKRIERDNIQRKKDINSINKKEADEKYNDLSTVEDLGVSIFSPEERITYDDKVDLHVVLSGANKSFVEFTLGVPKRVKLFINGNEYNYSGEDWVEDGENLVFKAKLAIGEIEAIKPINNPVHGIYDTASLSQHRSSQKIPSDKYVIIPRPIQFQRIAEYERFAIRKWYSISFKTIEEHRELFYFCYWPPYGWPGYKPYKNHTGTSCFGMPPHRGYKPRNEPTLYPGLNIVHVVAANGDENNEKSAQEVRMFYLNKRRE